jgi:hypothetical protein
MDAGFHLVKKNWRNQNGDRMVAYRGYVKLGLTKVWIQMEEPTAQPWEFRSKPAWQRLIIMLVVFLLHCFSL